MWVTMWVLWSTLTVVWVTLGILAITGYASDGEYVSRVEQWAIDMKKEIAMLSTFVFLVWALMLQVLVGK